MQASTSKLQEKRSKKCHYCVYCEKQFQKLPRHLETMHYNEKQAREALNLPKNSKERKKALLAIQHLGDYNHNYKVCETGNGVLVPKYRLRDDNERTYRDYVPCEYCYGLYVGELLWKHQKVYKSVKLQTSDQRGKPIANGKVLLPIMDNNNDLYRDVLVKMREDEIKGVLMQDNLILEFGKRLHEKDGDLLHRHNHISQRLRELGRILISFEEINGMKLSLDQVLLPENWELLLSAIKHAAGFSSETRLYDAPTLCLKVGHSLSKCAKMTRTRAIVNGDMNSVKKMEQFVLLYETEWTDRINARAHNNLHLAKFNEPQLLPLAKDIAIFHTFLETKSEALKLSTEILDNDKYRPLAEVVLAKVILFNRKRSGKAERIQLQDYKIVSETEYVPDSDIVNGLTKFAKRLCETQKN